MAQGDVEEEADNVYESILGEIGLEYIENDPVSFKYSNLYFIIESCKR